MGPLCRQRILSSDHSPRNPENECLRQSSTGKAAHSCSPRKRGWEPPSHAEMSNEYGYHGWVFLPESAFAFRG